MHNSKIWFDFLLFVVILSFKCLFQLHFNWRAFTLRGYGLAINNAGEHRMGHAIKSDLTAQPCFGKEFLTWVGTTKHGIETFGAFRISLSKWLARVTPIFKSGAKNYANNYRPTSVISIFSRMMERLVHDQLFDFLKVNKKLTCTQSAFQKLHSTIA